MSDQPETAGLAAAAAKALDAVGRFVAWSASAAIDHGPEALLGLMAVHVDVEHFELLCAEWANHPLLDFIQWQPAQAGQILAMTLPQEQLAGHAVLGRLIEPAVVDDGVLADLDEITARAEFSGWTADEFRHGLAHAGAGELDRALTPLTVGLEGLVRRSAVQRGLLDRSEADALQSGSQLVKRLWAQGDRYRPYMERWVFGLANTYRHGDDRQDAAVQALHAVCGAAIWADHLLGERTAVEAVEARIASETISGYSRGTLQLQRSAELRLERAAVKAGRSEAVAKMLATREQLLSIREAQRQRREPERKLEPALPDQT